MLVACSCGCYSGLAISGVEVDSVAHQRPPCHRAAPGGAFQPEVQPTVRWEPTNNCLERRRFQHLPWFFHAAHLIIIYIFGGSVKSHVLNAWLAPTINPEDVTRRPRRCKAANLRCEEQMGEPAIRSAQERRAEGVFPAASCRNVLAKLKTVIQTGIPIFEETMTGQRATSGAWSLVV